MASIETGSSPSIDSSPSLSPDQVVTHGVAQAVHEERQRRNQLRFIDFETDPTPHGFLISRHQPHGEIRIERTAANSHLFLYSQRTSEAGRFEVKYFHSDHVVNMLELFRPYPDNNLSPRPLAFFDTKGNFYDQARLLHIAPLTEQNITHRKHIAIFSMPDGEQHVWPEFAIAIDNIYSLTVAKPDSKATA